MISKIPLCSNNVKFPLDDYENSVDNNLCPIVGENQKRSELCK